MRTVTELRRRIGDRVGPAERWPLLILSTADPKRLVAAVCQVLCAALLVKAFVYWIYC